MKQIKQQRILYPQDRKPRVVIIGAGIAGLTVAHELVRRGEFNITVVEKRDEPGGKARTEWTDAGFREHSMRILPGSYVCMHQVLAEIQTETGFAIDHLRPASILFKHNDYHHTIGGDYASFAGIFRYLKDALGLLWFLRRAGVSLRDLIVFLYKTWSLLFTPERRVINELSRLKFSEYISGERSSSGFEDIIFRVAEILVAAKSYASAAVVSRTLLEWFVTPFLRGKLVRRQVSEFNLPTSDALITPWVRWLEQHDVQFQFGTTTKNLSAKAGKLHRIGVETIDRCHTLEADAFILAVQHNIADSLLDDSLNRYIPNFVDFPRLGEEWAHSVQFRVSSLKGKLKSYGARSVAFVDSPWSIGIKVYSQDSWGETYWRQTGLAEHEAILTATISNSNRPGKLYNRPLLRCTKEQILAEVLAQTGLQDELGTADGDLGLDVSIESDIDEDAFPGYGISAVGLPDQDLVFLSDSLMYIRLPGNLDIEPGNATGIYNLFLAGEYTRTNYRIPTMEKSCESGKRCAQEVLAGFDFAIDKSRIPTCQLPLPMFRLEVLRSIIKGVIWLAILITLVWLVLQVK